MPDPDLRCFACGRAIVPSRRKWAQTEDGAQIVPLGPECFRKIKRDQYWQPPKGGPRLCWIGSEG